MKKNFFVKAIFERGIPKFPKGKSPIEVPQGEPNGHDSVRKHPIWTEADMAKFVFLNILDSRLMSFSLIFQKMRNKS